MIQRIAVMGAGSLGTTMGAFLTRSGYDVTLVDAYREHVDALNQSGAHITGSVDITIPVRACCADCMEGNFDLFLYMAKQTHNAVAIPQMLAHSHNRTIVATCQNGLPEEALAEYFPRERILGVPTGWGGIFQGPGCTLLPSSLDSMACSVGTLTGTHLPELDEVAEILGSFLHVSISSQSFGAPLEQVDFQFCLQRPFHDNRAYPRSNHCGSGTDPADLLHRQGEPAGGQRARHPCGKLSLW